MALASVSVYELSRLSSNFGPPTAAAVRRRSNSTKVRRKADESLERRRKSHNIPNQDRITITYLGRPKSPNFENSKFLKNRKPSPTVIKKVPSTSSISTTPSSPTKKTSGVRKIQKTSGSTSSESTGTSSGEWMDCIEMVNEIGAVAKKENRNIRRVRIALSRHIKFEQDEEMVLMASRILSRSHGWTLDNCHDYLPILIDNLISLDYRNRLISLEGLAAISDNLLEKLIKFSNFNAHRIGVDIAAEERTEKAKNCITMLRSVVKKRDWYYRQLDEESVDRLDATMERLKRI
ncbi:hypothetical protein L3Y34_016321 [Caenorhabditis briggsae]|uniref:Katanin p80 subunit C-terminal domain-containing protein n=2 Tax=Caenorhabditis briggsae TaxID=6238 RepID=A0AAE9J0C3_CAEBR|nr:hypothetical protein L3Y34_016321 [Caenorhabditis briggsae]